MTALAFRGMMQEIISILLKNGNYYLLFCHGVRSIRGGRTLYTCPARRTGRVDNATGHRPGHRSAPAGFALSCQSRAGARRAITGQCHRRDRGSGLQAWHARYGSRPYRRQHGDLPLPAFDSLRIGDQGGTRSSHCWASPGACGYWLTFRHIWKSRPGNSER